MTKTVLYFWVLTSGGVSTIQHIDGFRSLEECRTAGVSLTEKNPHEKIPANYAVITRCIEVPT